MQCCGVHTPKAALHIPQADHRRVALHLAHEVLRLGQQVRDDLHLQCKSSKVGMVAFPNPLQFPQGRPSLLGGFRVMTYLVMLRGRQGALDHAGDVVLLLAPAQAPEVEDEVFERVRHRVYPVWIGGRWTL
jgi:hypothetical protein